jgi:RNA 2',3'-cyclic 3'-phosphodiesterase
MPRLFTGLEIPDAQTDYLLNLRGSLYGARWIDPENYHITLRFIGDIDRRIARDIENALGEIIRDPVEITLTDLSIFGGEKPHAIIVSVKPTRALLELQYEHERIMRELGLPKDPRKFTPHITLARLRGSSPTNVVDYLSSRRAFHVQSFIAKSFALYSAKPSTGGGPYVIEASYPLGEDVPDMSEKDWMRSYAPAK